MPERVQQRRIAGWRKPEGAVSVARPSKWGNPISLAERGAQFPSLDDRQVSMLVVRDFIPLAKRGRLSFPNWRFLGGERGPVEWTYPSLEEIRAELAGRDLMCFCPLDQPCHADVLLELANEGAVPAADVWRVMYEQNVSRNQAARVVAASLGIRERIDERKNS